jgi:hypothetical protein
VCYVNGLFVAVATGGTGNRVMTSGVLDNITEPDTNIPRTNISNTWEKDQSFSGNINISSGSVYKVNGTQVVGARGSAIADISTADATDLASAITLANDTKAKVNTILAMLRTHGLIAP